MPGNLRCYPRQRSRVSSDRIWPNPSRSASFSFDIPNTSHIVFARFNINILTTFRKHFDDFDRCRSCHSTKSRILFNERQDRDFRIRLMNISRDRSNFSTLETYLVRYDEVKIWSEIFLFCSVTVSSEPRVKTHKHTIMRCICSHEM